VQWLKITGMRYFFLVGFFCFCLFTNTALGQASSFTSGDRVVVVTDAVKVRDGAGLSSNTLGSQKNGAGGTVLNSSDGLVDGYFWLQLDYDEGVDGWSAAGNENETFIEKFNAVIDNGNSDSLQLLYSLERTVDTCLPSYCENESCTDDYITIVKEQKEFWSSITVSELQSLLNSGGELDVRKQDNFCTTPLQNSLYSGRFDLMQFLLEAGANVNELNFKGNPILFGAIELADTRGMQFLIDAGADVNATGSDGSTALMLATLYQDITGIQILLEAGADVNARDINGNTALMSAVWSKNLEKVRSLLAVGADVNARQSEGKTVLIEAFHSGDYDVVQELVNAGADTAVISSFSADLLIDAINKGNVKIVKFLLESGANANAAQYDGFNPLTSAIVKNKTDIVELLLEAGADANATTVFFDTHPLSLASINGNIAIIELLISAGADIDASDADGLTALMWATKKGHLETIEFLLQAGADTTLIDDEGKRAIDFAEGLKGTDAYEQLLAASNISSPTAFPLDDVTVINICESEIQDELFRSGRARQPSSTQLNERGLRYREEDGLWAYVVDAIYWNENDGGKTTFLCVVDPQRHVALEEYAQ
jgi:uncharacterized protein